MFLKLNRACNNSVETLGNKKLIQMIFFLSGSCVWSVSLIQIAHQSHILKNLILKYLNYEHLNTFPGQKNFIFKYSFNMRFSKKNLLKGIEAYCQGASNTIGRIWKIHFVNLRWLQELAVAPYYHVLLN